jgi:Demethylmenaquinone methyltransferase
MSSRLTPEQIETLTQLGVATLHEAQGQKGALDAGIKPLDPSLKLAGRALTVDCRPGDNLMIHHAVSIAEPGDVLVVDAKGYLEAGPWGDILTFAAQMRGIAGLIIDGAVRDAEAIIRMRFPVFARGLSIKGTTKNQPGRVNAPIVCGGVPVNPGDIVVGDRDGVVVIAANELDDVVRKARERERKEEAMRHAIQEGATTVDLLGLGPVLKSMGFDQKK